MSHSDLEHRNNSRQILISDSYLPGAAVLAHSLRDAGTSKKLAALVTLDTLLYDTLVELRKLFDYVIPVDKIANPNLDNLARLDRLDLRFTFTKLHLWRQEQFRKIVYVDADVVALRAPDELFDLDVSLAAAPDIGWPDCFNSGVMLLKPSEAEYWSLQTLAASGSSFDGADQGLLNEHYQHRPWKRLSFTYNCTPNSSYQYEPAYRHFRSSISMAHFIGKEKPWTLGRTALQSSGAGVYKELLGRWWSVFDRHFRADSQRQPNQHVRRFVSGENNAFSHQSPAPPPEASHVTAEQPFTETTEHVSEQDHNHPPAPPAFEPPQTQWDATRSAPPMDSRAEASSFPRDTHYEMSRSTGLFQAPQAYPAPPRDMYYSVPNSQPKPAEVPTPIFPWEQDPSTPKPTRIFADTPLSSVPPTPTAPVAAPSSTRHTHHASSTSASSASGDYLMRDNAWDNDPGIEEYLRAYKEATARRGRSGIVHGQSSSTEGLDLPGLSSPRNRRGSLRLSDFPTSDERPSLPVTPAPVQRQTFWSSERDEKDGVSAAAGASLPTAWVRCPRCDLTFVPCLYESTVGLDGPYPPGPRNATSALETRFFAHCHPVLRHAVLNADSDAPQNPIEKLEELRRNSLLATEELEKAPMREAPQRESLSTSSELPQSPQKEKPGLAAALQGAAVALTGGSSNEATGAAMLRPSGAEGDRASGEGDASEIDAEMRPESRRD